MSRIELVGGAIAASRMYTQSLLDAIDSNDWFRMPSEGVTHVAWLTGHMAIAEYSLTLSRIRGPKPEDAELFGDEFRALFGKGSTPVADASAYPFVEEIRAAFDRVHNQALAEIAGYSDDLFDEPTDPPHPLFTTKGGALLFQPQHEMLHAGQIGLLRRLFGNEPLR
jgi:hypothetical protein